MTTRRRALRAVSIAALVAVAAGACGTSSSGGTTSGGVVTSFYPIQFAAERIAGGKIRVSVLTKPGAEPHDLELAPKDVASIAEATLVIYSKGFQPAVDEGVLEADPAHVLDVSRAADLNLDLAAENGVGSGSVGSGSVGSGAVATANPDVGKSDPHFWLDPERYAAVAKAIGGRLAQVDPANAATYSSNTRAFVADLDALDREFAAGLTSCAIKQLVTSHSAFGYLAERYGFIQQGITGVSPDAEPSAASLSAINDLVRKDGVTTIYQETLVEPHFAQTVANSTGAKLATLDPIEGITTTSAGKDYFEVMRSNLKTLEQGQGCR